MESKSKAIIISDDILKEPGMTIQILKERIALQNAVTASEYNELGYSKSNTTYYVKTNLEYLLAGYDKD